MTKPTQIHDAFEWRRSETIDALNVVVEEYRHKKTGAPHYHMSTDNDENVFLVALRTVPTDSTGVAHILEHTALCGSKRYPVRDPFFMMIRRSLNTFMNAFTSSDWTAYPFASQNRKDFDNLLDVYLDAVFFSRLDELDFAQEGHRVEFSEADDPESPLVFKGVVFNEMKGAMSSMSSTLWQTLCKYLYPQTTYHFNSGGDPEHIPDLSYAQLKSFYESHYHPSNAIFMTYGDIPAIEHHEKFESLALGHFERHDDVICVEDERRYYAPVRVQESYAYNEPGELGDKTHLVLGWLLGKSTDLEDLLTAQLISSVLLDNSASPLQKVLETTDLGNAPSPLCGLEDSNLELVFVCGIEGSKEEHADAFEQLVINTLQQVADEGIPLEHVEAVLHQLELSQREIGGDGYPYGLQLIIAGLASATHRGDPIALLNLEPVIVKLREQIKDPEFIKSKVRELLLDNQHRVRLVMVPDADIAQRREDAETNRLAALKAGMDDADAARIIKLTQDLAARQTQQDDESILPKVGLEDVPETLHIADGETLENAGIKTHFYGQGTNGLVYQQVIIDLPQLDDDLIAVLPYYTHCLTEIGIGDKDYLETQNWQSAVCGAINAFSSIKGKISDEQDISGYIVLSAKALLRNYTPMSELIRATMQNPRFNETNRLREIVAQIRARSEQSVTGNGHALAMAAASSGMSPAASLSHKLSGLQGIKAVKALDKDLDDEAALLDFSKKLAAIHEKVLQSKRQFLVIGESANKEKLLSELAEQWQSVSAPSASIPFSLPAVREQVKQIWQTNTQVNFCAKAYPTVPNQHADAPALTVLGGFLRNGYLHRTIREQGGAYGGGASQDSNVAAFRFFSYRDPRLVETLEDFDQAIDWILNEEHEWRQVEESILGVISSIDKPGSPAGEAKQACHNELFGRTPEERKKFRTAVLNVTIEDLQRVTREYLIPEQASIAVISNEATLASLSEQLDTSDFEHFKT